VPSDLQSAAVYLLALVVGVLGWLATHLVARPYLVYRALRAEIARSLVHFSMVDGVASARNGYEWPEAVQARTRALEFVGELEACKATRRILKSPRPICAGYLDVLACPARAPTIADAKTRFGRHSAYYEGDE